MFLIRSDHFQIALVSTVKQVSLSSHNFGIFHKNDKLTGDKLTCLTVYKANYQLKGMNKDETKNNKIFQMKQFNL